MNTVNEALFCIDNALIAPLEATLAKESGILFVFKVSGELKISILDTQKELDKGSVGVFLVDKHYKVSDSGNTAYFTVSGRLCEALMELYGIYSGVCVRLDDGAEDFFKICQSKEASEQAYYFHRILKKIARTLAMESVKKTDTARLIKEYIDAHAGQKLTLDTVAEVFFLSKSQIFRIFKGRYGIPPMQYYIQKKVEAARDLLINTEMRISDIADALAFSDSKHLSKAFLGIYGVLPKDCRKEHRLKKTEIL